MEIETDKQMYELAYLVVPTVAQESLAADLASLKSEMASFGVLSGDEQAPKMHPLAYAIPRRVGEKKFNFTEAYFGWFRLSCVPEHAKEIKRLVDKQPYFLRFLITTVDAHKLALEKKAAEAKALEKAEGENAPVSDEQLDRHIEDLLSPVL